MSKSFGSVQALTDVDFEVRAGEVMALVGDNGAGKSTLIKCVAGIHTADGGEIIFDGKPVTIHGPKDSAQARDRGRLPGSRALRQPRRRPEHVPRPGGARRLPAAQGARDGAADGRDDEEPRRHDDPLDPPARRDALRRPAPVGRGRPRRDVELPARHPRRADGRARRRADRAGARARRRASPSRGSRSSSSRTTCTTSSRSPTRITVLRLGRTIARLRARRRRPSRRSSARSPPACRRRSRASRRHASPRWRRVSSTGRRDPDVGDAEDARHRAERDRASNISAGNLGSWPVVIGLALIVLVLLVQGRQLLHRRATSRNIITQMAGTTTARLRRRLRAADRRDRPLDQLRQRRRRRRRRRAAAAGNWHAAARVALRSSLAILACALIGAVPGLDRRADRRAVVRRHARRLRDLAGRDPEDRSRRA